MERDNLRDDLSQLKMGIWGDLPAKCAHSSLLAVKEISGDGFIPQCLTRAVWPAGSKQHRSFLVISECFKRNWIPWLWLYVTGLILELEKNLLGVRQRRQNYETTRSVLDNWFGHKGALKGRFRPMPNRLSKSPYLLFKICRSRDFMSNPCSSSTQRNINIR